MKQLLGYKNGAVAKVDDSSTFATAPFGILLDKAEAKGNQYRHKE